MSSLPAPPQVKVHSETSELCEESNTHVLTHNPEMYQQHISLDHRTCSNNMVICMKHVVAGHNNNLLYLDEG